MSCAQMNPSSRCTEQTTYVNASDSPRTIYLECRYRYRRYIDDISIYRPSSSRYVVIQICCLYSWRVQLRWVWNYAVYWVVCYKLTSLDVWAVWGRALQISNSMPGLHSPTGLMSTTGKYVLPPQYRFLSIYLSKKSRLRRRKCRDTTRAPNNVS